MIAPFMKLIPYNYRLYRLITTLSASLAFVMLAVGCAPRAVINNARDDVSNNVNDNVINNISVNNNNLVNNDNITENNDETAAPPPVPAIPATYRYAAPDRVGILEADVLVYDVSAGGVLEYRDDWSRRASRQAAVSAALAMKSMGASPIIVPDLRRARDVSRLKTQLRYHSGAFQSDFFADKRLAFSSIGWNDTTPYSAGPLDSLCARYGVNGFLYVYGYEERFSEERRRVLSELWNAANEAAKAPEVRAAPQLPLPAERMFTAAMLVEEDGRIVRYRHSLNFNDIDLSVKPSTLKVSEEDWARSGPEPEKIHTESLMAQARAMERRFRSQNLFFEDRYLEEYLNDILEKLATPDERKLYDLRVRLLRSNAVNAFAAPDGAIYICTGLLARVANEAQAAAILAHELTHVINRHTMKNLLALKDTSRVQAEAAIAALTESSKQKRKSNTESASPAKSSTPRSNSASIQARGSGGLLMNDGIIGSMTGDALRAAVGGYKRDLEREADSVGLARMAAAGYRHEEFYALFAMLRDWIVTERIDERYFFSSHPVISERLENYRRFADGINGAGTVDKDNSQVRGANNNAGKGNTQENVIDKSFFTLKFRSVILYDAVTNHAAGRPDLVDAQLERVLSADSSDVDALIMRGDMERQMSPRSTASLVWYEKALRYEPRNLAALRAAGFACHAIGDMSSASKYLRRYCDIAPDAPDINMAKEALRQCGE